MALVAKIDVSGTIEYVQEDLPTVTLTLEEVKKQYLRAVQEYLDSEAQKLGYDNITTASSYAASPNFFQAEGQAFLTWRAEVWQACYAVQAEVDSGIRQPMSFEELLAELPPSPVPVLLGV